MWEGIWGNNSKIRALAMKGQQKCDKKAYLGQGRDLRGDKTIEYNGNIEKNEAWRQQPATGFFLFWGENMKREAQPLKLKRDILNVRDYLREEKEEKYYILFMLGISTGYRTGDLLDLTVRDIKAAIKRKRLDIIEGKRRNNPNTKNKSPRKAPLHKDMIKLLDGYIIGKKDYEFLFRSRNGKNKALSVQQVSNTLKEAGEYFGLYDITGHSMRKTYAYNMYMDNNKDIVKVQRALGHYSVTDTVRYLGVGTEFTNEVLPSMNNWF